MGYGCLDGWSNIQKQLSYDSKNTKGKQGNWVTAMNTGSSTLEVMITKALFSTIFIGIIIITIITVLRLIVVYR
jgi:hypothetical protein